MPHNFVFIRVPGTALSILFLMSICSCLFAQQQNGSEPASWARRAYRSLLVIDASSTVSEGPDSLLTFDPSGAPSSFAANISSQPDIRGLVFDVEHDGPGNEKENRDGKVYATLAAENEIPSFDSMGNSSSFADASDGRNFPAAITKYPLRH